MPIFADSLVSSNINTSQGLSILLFLATIWAVPWKGIALWKAAKNDSKAWFIVLLLINTLAILEILYIFIFSKKTNKPISVTDKRPTINTTPQ